ncbi:MAG: hypothetical protein WKG07_36150 [Hymenobacter sp.]
MVGLGRRRTPVRLPVRRQGEPLPDPHHAGCGTCGAGVELLYWAAPGAAAARRGKLGPVLWQLPAKRSPGRRASWRRCGDVCPRA